MWTTTETRQVLREDPAGDSLRVQLAAARNEWRGFQILLRSDAAVAGIAVQAGDLSGPDGAVLPASAARIYRQHQLEVTTATYRNDRFRPGWYPDPLIPSVHPLTGQPLAGARLQALPFDLPAGQTHGFWVDVYVPAAAKAGRYAGTYRVAAPGRPAVEIPVELTVWDFALPATPSWQTALGSPAQRMRGYYRQTGRRRQGTGTGRLGRGRDAMRGPAGRASRERHAARRPAEACRPSRTARSRFRQRTSNACASSSTATT